MTTPSDRIRRSVTLASDSAAAFTGLLEPLLAETAGQGGRRLSLSSWVLDLAGAARDARGPATAAAWVERATRTLVFASGEVRTADGALLAAASAVFSERVATTA